MQFQSISGSPEAPKGLKIATPDISDPLFNWLSPDRLDRSPSDDWKQWLFDSSSLTQLLIQKSKQDFSVEVVAEGWVVLSRVEVRGKFGPVSADHRFWSRKVILLGHNKPWVLAHTLVPEHSFLSPLKQVQDLNEKPLGEYLFSHPDLVRSGMDITPFAGDSWGRRSLFYLFGKPLMVAEFFLPSLLE